MRLGRYMMLPLPISYGMHCNNNGKTCSPSHWGARRRRARRRWMRCAVIPYKILFYFEAFVHESMILLLPPPTCTARTIAILLTSIAHYTTPQ